MAPFGRNAALVSSGTGCAAATSAASSNAAAPHSRSASTATQPRALQASASAPVNHAAEAPASVVAWPAGGKPTVSRCQSDSPAFHASSTAGAANRGTQQSLEIHSASARLRMMCCVSRRSFARPPVARCHVSTRKSRQVPGEKSTACSRA